MIRASVAMLSICGHYLYISVLILTILHDLDFPYFSLFHFFIFTVYLYFHTLFPLYTDTLAAELYCIMQSQYVYYISHSLYHKLQQDFRR
jgi:hypothetical protein